MSKTIIQQSHVKVSPLPSNLVLTVENKKTIEPEIKKYFMDKKVFSLDKPATLHKLKMTSYLELEGSGVRIYLFLFGTKGELFMKDYTYIKTYDSDVNEISLLINPRDIYNPKIDSEIISFAFATKDEAAQISFHLEEK